MKYFRLKRDIFFIVLTALLCVFLCSRSYDVSGQSYLPTSGYAEKKICGFTVKIPRNTLDSAFVQQALARLSADLETIVSLFSETQLKALRPQAIWMEVELNPEGAACYHPSKQWLSENGMNPDKEHCVEISNMRNYLKWTAQNQPYMVLHELSHLYHHQVLKDGYENKRVKSVYEQAKASEKYEAVRYYNGKDTVIQKAYAMNNQMEYFAELSEAYFGRNDYFPFNYDDLKIFDPAGFALMKEIWEKKE